MPKILRSIRSTISLSTVRSNFLANKLVDVASVVKVLHAQYRRVRFVFRPVHVVQAITDYAVLQVRVQKKRLEEMFIGHIDVLEESDERRIL